MTKTKKNPMKNLVQPTEAEQEMDEELENASAAQLLAEHSRQLSSLQARVSQIEAVQGQVKLYMPRDMKPLGRRQVEAIMAKDPTVEFEVVDDYKRGGMRMNKGKIFCALNYKDIPAHVSSGLKLVESTAG